MKRIINTLLLFFTVSSVAMAQREKSLLYEISGNGLTRPSYLFGTFHIRCPEDYDLNELTKSKLQATEQTVLELDMDDPKMMMEMQKYLFMKDGQSLQTLLSADDYTLVANYFTDSLQMPFQMMNKVKPFALSSMLYPKILGCPMQSYEMDFVKLSSEAKHEVLGLEEVADQMSVFDKIPYEKQAKDLVKSVAEMDKSKGDFAKMIAAYKSKDIDAIAKVVEDEENGLAEYTDVLLTDRNRDWIPKMGIFAKAKPTFFAVGAGHLGGEEGIINLLRKSGYKVSPVTI